MGRTVLEKKQFNRWEGVELFTQIVETGSFSKAAEMIGISKSHASRLISHLENQLNAQLLVRTTRSLSVTEAGQAFYSHCMDILSRLNEATQVVQDLQETPQGSLRIVVLPSLGEKLISPAAMDFMQSHPELSIEIEHTMRPVDLVAEGYDLRVFISPPLKDSSLIARKIAPVKQCLFASPNYFSRHGKPTTLDDLEHHQYLNPFITINDGKRNIDIPVSCRWKTNNGLVQVEAARRGLGLMQTSTFYVKDDFASGALESVMESLMPNDMSLWAVYPHSRHLSTKIRLFINFLTERFSDL